MTLTHEDPMSTNAATIENMMIYAKANKDMAHQSISCPPRIKEEIAQARLGTLHATSSYFGWCWFNKLSIAKRMLVCRCSIILGTAVHEMIAHNMKRTQRIATIRINACKNKTGRELKIVSSSQLARSLKNIIYLVYTMVYIGVRARN